MIVPVSTTKLHRKAHLHVRAVVQQVTRPAQAARAAICLTQHRQLDQARRMVFQAEVQAPHDGFLDYECNQDCFNLNLLENNAPEASAEELYQRQGEDVDPVLHDGGSSKLHEETDLVTYACKARDVEGSEKSRCAEIIDAYHVETGTSFRKDGLTRNVRPDKD